MVAVHGVGVGNSKQSRVSDIKMPQELVYIRLVFIIHPKDILFSRLCFVVLLIMIVSVGMKCFWFVDNFIESDDNVVLFLYLKRHGEGLTYFSDSISLNSTSKILIAHLIILFLLFNRSSLCRILLLWLDFFQLQVNIYGQTVRASVTNVVSCWPEVTSLMVER